MLCLHIKDSIWNYVSCVSITAAVDAFIGCKILSDL